MSAAKTGFADLEFRADYVADPCAFAALADLLQDTFDIDIRVIDRFGGPDPTSMPSGYFDAAGRCVANFSAFSLPLVIDGKLRRAAGYQPARCDRIIAAAGSTAICCAGHSTGRPRRASGWRCC